MIVDVEMACGHWAAEEGIFLRRHLKSLSTSVNECTTEAQIGLPCGTSSDLHLVPVTRFQQHALAHMPSLVRGKQELHINVAAGAHRLMLLHSRVGAA